VAILTEAEEAALIMGTLNARKVSSIDGLIKALLRYKPHCGNILWYVVTDQLLGSCSPQSGETLRAIRNEGRDFVSHRASKSLSILKIAVFRHPVAKRPIEKTQLFPMSK
jgi:hypothetical protein